MAKVTVRNRNKDQVYKDGRKKPANWEYRFPIAPVNGVRKHSSQAGFKTQKEAFEAGTKALSEYLGTGDAFKPEKISVSDVIDLWMKNHVELNLKEQTILTYKYIIKNHIDPAFGSFFIQRIRPIDLQTLLNDMVKQEYSIGYIRSVYTVMKGFMKYAVEPCQYIKHSPMMYVNIPKSQKEEKEKQIISQEDFKRITERFPQGSTFYIPLMVSYHTGLRLGEVLGLTWNNIDFENKTLTVEKQLQYIHSFGIKQTAIGSPKTKASYRTIPIGDVLFEVLRKERLIQKQNRLKYGNLYLKYGLKKITPRYTEVIESEADEIDFVCRRENGDLVRPISFKYLSRVVNHKMNIRFEFHALRHTHATMLVESGANIKGVQQRLGHGHVTTTLQIYSHFTDSLGQDTIDSFEKALK